MHNAYKTKTYRTLLLVSSSVYGLAPQALPYQNQSKVSKNEIDVRFLGVTGNGVTLDGPAVEKALAINPQASFFFPPGKYLLDNTKGAGIDGKAFSGELRFAPGAILVCNDVSPKSQGCVQFVGGQGLTVQGMEIAYTKPTPQNRNQASGFALHLFGEVRPRFSGIRIDGSPSIGIYEEQDVDAVFTNIVVKNTSADGFSSVNSRNTSLTNLTTDFTMDDGLSVISYAKQPDNRGFVGSNIHVSHAAARGITVPGQSDVEISDFSVDQTCAQGVLVVTDTTYATRTPDNVSITNGKITGAGHYTNEHYPCKDPASNPNGIGLQYSQVGSIKLANITISDSTAPSLAGNNGPKGPSAESVILTDIKISGSKPQTKSNTAGGGVTIYNTRHLSISGVSIENASGGFFISNNGNVTAKDLSAANVKGFLNRSFDFEHNDKVEAEHIVVTDEKDAPTGDHFVDYQNKTPSSYKRIESHIKAGDLKVKKDDGATVDRSK